MNTFSVEDSRIVKWLQVAFILLVVAVSFYAHQRAGLTLPVPWYDEAWHAWEGHAFARDGSLLAPEINPERPTVFKGHGYSVFLGVVFKMFGFSLPVARGSSWAAITTAFVLICLLLWRLPFRSPNLLVVSLLYLGPPFVVAGNVVREDALTLALVGLAFLLFQRRRPLASLAVAGLGVVVHPNALYFFLALLCCAVWLLRKRWIRPTLPDWIIMGLCGAGILASAVFVFRHWDFFILDFFGPGLSAQASRSPMNTLVRPGNILTYIWFATLVAVAFRRDRRWLLLLLFGMCCLLPHWLNQEMWYAVYRVTGYGMLMLASIRFLVMGIARVILVRKAAFQELLALLLALPFLYASRAYGDIEGPRGYPRDMEWRGGGGMAMASPEVPYLTQADIEAMAGKIRDQLREQAGTIVEFTKLGGDSLFFAEALPEYQIRQRVYTSQGGDIMVFHLSRYQPKWVRDRVHDQMTQYGVDVNQPIYLRDGTEKWYIQKINRAINDKR